MPAPKNFSVENADEEAYIIDNNHPTHVICYRFGDRTKDNDWLTAKRRETGGDFVLPGDIALNDWALKQSSYGSKSEGAKDNPFLSIATDYASCFQNGEGWVQEIIRNVPDMGVFSIPFELVYRPSPTKSISKMETEWLYCDSVSTITTHLVEWRVNPYLANH